MAGVLFKDRVAMVDRVIKNFGRIDILVNNASITTERKYGRIISISSVIGLRGNIGQANYASASTGGCTCDGRDSGRTRHYV